MNTKSTLNVFIAFYVDKNNETSRNSIYQNKQRHVSDNFKRSNYTIFITYIFSLHEVNLYNHLVTGDQGMRLNILLQVRCRLVWNYNLGQWRTRLTQNQFPKMGLVTGKTKETQNVTARHQRKLRLIRSDILWYGIFCCCHIIR